ncbi:hypothetical protein CEXT_764031 [Caerostris extrusa]|uniref:Uncharacterized protein n=1 Tax=Caerostris extrusa TaxID=172846 RepID=A0AAV4Y801_CAEEX|nr:hypothetical protein CEXT_764031 [Caerostris extrusa]
MPGWGEGFGEMEWNVSTSSIGRDQSTERKRFCFLIADNRRCVEQDYKFQTELRGFGIKYARIRENGWREWNAWNVSTSSIGSGSISMEKVNMPAIPGNGIQCT